MSDLPARLQRLIRSDVQGLHAYAIQPSAGLVKLDAMENPHRLPDRLQAELGQRLGALALNRYPGERVHDLRAALAVHAGMPDGFDIMLGNGSDELISLIAHGLRRAGRLHPGAGSRIRHVCHERPVAGPEVHRGAFDRGLRARRSRHAGGDRPRPAIGDLSRLPQQPHRQPVERRGDRRIIEAAPGLVVIDEAYQPFSSRSYIARIGRHDHVLLMRTLSKFGLAGVRIGYLMGPKALIAQIDKVRPPYNISVLNCEAALFALEHADVFAAQAQDLREQRALLAARPGRIARRQDLAQRRQHDPGPVSGRPADLCRA